MKLKKNKDMSNTWYKFWKKSGPMQAYIETYTLLEDRMYPSANSIKAEVEHWATTVGGGFNTHYTYGFERVDKPPKEWLEQQINHLTISINLIQKDIDEMKGYL